MPVAQVNIARILKEKGDPSNAEFFENLAAVNAMAERMPGFLWRLIDGVTEADGSVNATSLRPTADPMLLINMSVWETADDLARFVFRTVHVKFYQKREAWFEPPAQPGFAMWTVAEGHRPTTSEALERLADLRMNGASERVFGWAALPGYAEFQSMRCG